VFKKTKPNEIERTWYFVDAKGEVLGRLASEIAKILQGKHRPYYTPHWDMGDYVVIINAKDIAVTGRKEEQKKYYHHSGYPGGLKQETLEESRQRRPTEIINRAVKGMMPKNKLAKQMMKKLFVYVGNEHPHGNKELKNLKTQNLKNQREKSKKKNYRVKFKS